MSETFFPNQTKITGSGYTCAYCNNWVEGTNTHYCSSKASAEASYTSRSPDWARITLVLERIADALERMNR